MNFLISQNGGGEYVVIDRRTNQVRYRGSLDGARQAQAQLTCGQIANSSASLICSASMTGNRMNLYLDTEFDGHGGPLISLALAGDDGSTWYGIFDAHCGTDWVAANVAPKLYAIEPTISGNTDTLRLSLAEFLRNRAGCTIWADWPADFEHLMRLMAGPTYTGSFVIPCTMRLIETPPGEPRPEHPHNALSDALALMRWHKS